ncbi:hypothetical protein YC2023_016936 [Brassica napus]
MMVAQICATEGGLNGTKAQSRNPKAQIGKKPFNYGIVDRFFSVLQNSNSNVVSSIQQRLLLRNNF